MSGKIGKPFIPPAGSSETSPHSTSAGGFFSRDDIQSLVRKAKDNPSSRAAVITRLNASGKVMSPLLGALFYYPGLENQNLPEVAGILMDTHSELVNRVAEKVGIDVDSFSGYLNGPVAQALSDVWRIKSLNEENPHFTANDIEQLTDTISRIFNGVPSEPEVMFNPSPDAMAKTLSEGKHRIHIFSAIERVVDDLGGISPRVTRNMASDEVTERLFEVIKRHASNMTKSLCDKHDVSDDSVLRVSTYQSFLKQITTGVVLPSLNRYSVSTRRELSRIKKDKDITAWNNFVKSCEEGECSHIEQSVLRSIESGNRMYEAVVMNDSQPKPH